MQSSLWKDTSLPAPRDRCATNPLFGPNKLKLGIFTLNGDANRRTSPPEHYRFNWENSLAVAETADAAGFEVVVPFARWRSIAGPGHFGGNVFDSTAWAAAVAARTRQCAIMSTIHITLMHPVAIAKAITTIDHISGGRAGINIVCGWFEAEMKQFGQNLLPHERRYDYAEEWITAIKRLWTSDEPVNLDGDFIKIEDGLSTPKPIQAPYPGLMNAASSASGRSFVGKHCDMAFIPGRTEEEMRRDSTAYRAQVRAEWDRDVQIWTPCAVVQGDTQADAERLAQLYVDHADTAQLEQAFRLGSPYHPGPNASPEFLAERKRKFAIAGDSYLIVGDPEHIAQKLRLASEAGIDGLLLTFVDPQDGLNKFIRDVLPLLIEDGLRK